MSNFPAPPVASHEQWLKEAEKLAMEFAHCYAFVGDDTMPRRKAALMDHLRAEPLAWQPIATAPKGRKVLAGYPNKLGKWRTVTARYYLPQTLQMEDDRDDLDDDGYAPEGWYEESETQDGILPTDESPTHWMPLPAAPGAAA